MFILFLASSSHPPLTTTSSSFRVRNKGKVKVELENKEKKKITGVWFRHFLDSGPRVLDDLTTPCIEACFLTGHLSGFFNFFFFSNWRIIAICCDGFCHTTT